MAYQSGLHCKEKVAERCSVVAAQRLPDEGVLMGKKEKLIPDLTVNSDEIRRNLNMFVISREKSPI